MVAVAAAAAASIHDRFENLRMLQFAADIADAQ